MNYKAKEIADYVRQVFNKNGYSVSKEFRDTAPFFAVGGELGELVIDVYMFYDGKTLDLVLNENDESQKIISKKEGILNKLKRKFPEIDEIKVGTDLDNFIGKMIEDSKSR